MDRLLAFASDNQVAVLTVLGILAVVIIGLMAYFILRGSRQAAPAGDQPPPATLDLVASPVTVAAAGAENKGLAKAFRHLLREGFASYRDSYSRNPYLMPWLLRIGGPDDGGLMAAVEEIRPAVGIPEAGALSWHFYEHGVVLDLADKAMLRPLLNFVGRRRPDLPLEGVVITVPVDKLRDTQSAAAYGAEIYNQLWQVQQQLGFTVPLYVVVTGTEQLESFRSFESILPRWLRSTILGWAFPYPLETAFTPEYVGEALSTVEQGMLAIVLEAFGRVLDSRMGNLLVRCKEDLAGMAEPLRAFLGTALRRTAFQECHYFRGLFFIARPVPIAPASFAHDLIERKIFAESGLPKPMRGPGRPRSWRRWLWPVAVPLAAAVAVASVWASVLRVQDYREQATPILKATAIDIDAMANRPARSDNLDASVDASVRYLRNVAQLAKNEPFLFVPLSWFEHDPYQLEAAMRAGWRKIVLRTLKSLIEQRLEGLGRVQAGDLPDTALMDFLTRVGEAEGFARVFNRFGRGNADLPVRDVLQYALKVSVPGSTIDKLRTWRAIGADAEPIDDPDLRIDLDRFRPPTLVAFRDLADAYFQQLAQGGQVGARLEVVVTELAALAQGQRSPAESEVSFAEVSAGLDDASNMLAAGRPTWLGADSPVIPTDVQRVLDVAALSSLIGPEGREDAMSVARRRYAEVKDRVGQIRSVIGPLVTRNSGGSAALTGDADALRQMLGQWFNRPFMRRSPADRIVVRPQGGGWDAMALEAIPPLFDDYQLFDAKVLSQAPPTLRPSMRKAAQYRLRNGVERILATAAPAIDPRMVENASLAQLREISRNLHVGFPVLGQTIQSFMQNGMGEPADLVRAQITRSAAAVLIRLNRIVEDDQLYRPSAIYLSAWQGGLIAPDELFNQRGPGGLNQYLVSTRLEIASLAREVAGSSVDILQRPIMASASGSAAAEWQGILTALDQYDGQRPNSTLMQLEKFIREDLPKIDTANCFAAQAPVDYAPDWFGNRLAQLRDQVFDRCIALSEERLYGGYRQIATLFNERLAGRPPFGSGNQLDAADPSAVREIYGLLESRAKDVVEPIRSLAATHPQWRDPAQFLTALLGARDLLLHVAGGGAVVVQPTFRVNREREVGGSNIIEWKLRVADQTAGTFAKGSVQWRSGDPVGLDLRWAKDGPIRPVQLLGGQAAGIDGLTASYRQSGPWSLLSFIRGQQLSSRERAVRTAVAGTTLQFEARTQEVAPGTEDKDRKSVPPQPLTPAVPVAANCRVFLGLELRRVVEADGKVKEEPIAIPYLPETAPQVAMRSSARRAGPQPSWTRLDRQQILDRRPEYLGGPRSKEDILGTD